MTGAHRGFALAMGLFLGLALVKFGNPVILDHKLDPPSTLAEFLAQPWPVRWANVLLTLVTSAGFVFLGTGWFARFRRLSWAMLLLPLGWIGWVFLSAGRSEDAFLTGETLPQLSGCVVCYFLGALVLGVRETRRWLWVGLLVALTWVLMRGAHQQFGELGRDYQTLVDGERTDWKDFPPEVLARLEKDGVLVRRDGRLRANEAILLKLRKGRINGTLVYPNALAGAILLLAPLGLTLAVRSTGVLRPGLRAMVIGLAGFLSLGCLYWTGSKSGWLIALGMGLVWVWVNGGGMPRARWGLLGTLAGIGLLVFGVRFAGYFRAGATSASARMDYWTAGLKIARAYPVFGTGPGTFQKPYVRFKRYEAEMARLVHNDYLEQACDSGWPAFVLYLGWVVAIVVVGAPRGGRGMDAELLAAWLGVLGWFVQGTVEFSLYIPALAWTAFTLSGVLVGERINSTRLEDPASLPA